MSDFKVEERPWGNYQVLADSPTHKVKRLTVTPGHRLSYQRHRHRAEHWYVVAGQAVVILEGTEHTIDAGCAIDIPLGAAHRVGNRADEPMVLIEVQVGDYFGEDDIERLEDDYGRTS